MAVIILAALCDGDPIKSLFSVTALLIVFGGTLTALLTQFGFGPLLAGLARFRWLIKPPLVDLYAFHRPGRGLVEPCALPGRAGAGGRARQRHAIPSQKRGLQMIIDNTSQEDLHATLSVLAEKSSREEHVSGEIWEAGGGYLPTIGVMGAVLGLIHVMMRLDHPAELGEGIATAFVATIYGVGAANLIFLPHRPAPGRSGGGA